MKDGWHRLLQLLAEIDDPRTMDRFLDAILTPGEQADLDKRMRIFTALIAGNKPQRIISEELEVSVSKVTRGANALKRAHPDAIKRLSGQ